MDMKKINRKAYFEIIEIEGNNKRTIKEVKTFKSAIREFENIVNNNSTKKYILWDNIGNRKIY